MEYLTGLAPDMRKPSSKVHLGPSAPPIDPIHRLRLFSNYLTPRKGLLSADTWRAITVVGRNLILTWLVLLPVMLSVALVAQLYFLAQPATAYGFACAVPSPPDSAGATAPLPAICAEVKGKLPPNMSATATEPYDQVLVSRLAVAAKPLLVLGTWVVAAVVAWLLVGATGFLPMIGMMAGLLLVATTLYSLGRQYGLVGSNFEFVLDLETGLMAGGTLVILVLWWLLPVWRDRRSLAGEGQQDSREARTNRATRLQSTLSSVRLPRRRHTVARRLLRPRPVRLSVHVRERAWWCITTCSGREDGQRPASLSRA